jgi:hypothetical protein
MDVIIIFFQLILLVLQVYFLTTHQHTFAIFSLIGIVVLCLISMFCVKQ